VEEMVAMVREDGADREMIVPPTIHALLQARLDRLEGDERTVIERGSVEGKIFHRGAVLELAPEPVRPAVGTHLLSLVRKELMRRAVVLLPVGPPARADLLPDYYFTLFESAELEAAGVVVAELQGSEDERAQAFGALFRAELEVLEGGEGVGPAFKQAVASAAEKFELLGDAKGLAYASRLAALERWASLRMAEAIEKF